MTPQIKILPLFIWLISIGKVIGQTTYSMCYIHTVYSQNDKFFLQTIPFDNIGETTTGNTVVFDSHNLKVSEIPRYFEVIENRKDLFISNDGNTVAYVIDREYKWDGIQNNCVEIFKNGVSFKKYALTDFINCNADNEDCFLFYKDAIDSISWENGKRDIRFKENATDFEKQLTDRAAFCNNDTLYIFAKTGKLIMIDLNSTNFSISPFAEADEKWFKQITPVKIKSEKFKPSFLYGLPNLSNGKSFEKSLAEYISMAVFPEDKRNSYKYKRHSLYIEILVDTLGNASLDKTDDYRELPEDKINAFIKSNKFEVASIPKEVEKWRFSGWVQFMNKSKKEAKGEKEKKIVEERVAYKKRIVADSLNGLYIPKNLEECFIELNKLLKPKDVEAIKNLKDRNETILYHHGFGTWLRNNWGLWGGSRLQQYLIKKGIDHPDSMSAIILEYYYDWLNGQNDKWKEFEAK